MRAHERLEAEFGAWAGFRPEQTVACSSGTAGLHLALEALRLPQGSEVVIPDYTMIACPRAASMAGLTPVLADCRDDLLMDQGLLGAAAGPRTRAVMPVHVYGRRCDMGGVHEFAKALDLYVVEDLSEAHGVAPHPATDAAVWSLYQNKHITTGGEGGVVAFRDPEAAALARSLRCLGFTEAHDYACRPRGSNYRLAEVLAEKAIASLRDYAPNLLERSMAELWCDQECPAEWRTPPRECPWVYDVRIPGLTRGRQAAAVRALRAEGVAARMGFLPMSQQEEYASCRRVGGKNAALAAGEVLYLSLQPGLLTRARAALAFDVLKRSV